MITYQMLSQYVKLETLERGMSGLRRKKGWLQLNVGRSMELLVRKRDSGKSLGESRVSLVMNGGLTSQASPF